MIQSTDPSSVTAARPSGSTVTGYLADPRGRLLFGLAVAAVVLVLASALVLSNEARRMAVRFTPRPIFPNIVDIQEKVAQIEIVDTMGAVMIRKTQDGHWVVPAADDYPADADQQSALGQGLTDVTAVEKRTARPDWLGALDLVAPEDGGLATRITLSDAKGQTLAELLVGKPRTGGGLSVDGGERFYVRRGGENQTFLAVGSLPLDTARRDWLQPDIVDLPRERIKRVMVAPADGPAYAIARADPAETNFKVAADDLPPGREMMSETVANGIGAAVIDVTLDDVAPVETLDFSKASHIVFETFDGLRLAIDIIDHDDKPWIRVKADAIARAELEPSSKTPASEASASKTPATGLDDDHAAETDPGAEAQAIEARTKAWAYAIPSWKAALLRKPLESLLRTPGDDGDNETGGDDGEVILDALPEAPSDPIHDHD